MTAATVELPPLTPNPNYKEYKEYSAWKRWVDYSNETAGVFRIFQVVDKGLRLIAEIFQLLGSFVSEAVYDVARKFGLGWTLLSVARIFGSAKDSAEKWSSVGPAAPATFGQVAEVIDKTADVTSTAAYAVAVITDSLPAKIAGDVLSAVGDASTLYLKAENWYASSTAANAIDLTKIPKNQLEEAKETKEGLNRSATNALLRIAKAVFSIITGVIGLSVFIWGVPAVPAVALIAMSLASTIFAMAAHLHESASPTKMHTYAQLEPFLATVV